MNREDIIGIAKTLAGPDYVEAAVNEKMLDEFMPVFLAIAAHVREECIDWIRAFSIVGDRSDDMINVIRARSQQ